MQRKTTFGLVLLLFVLSIGLAAAQGFGGGGGFGRGFGGGAGLGMLRIPEVQQELKMTQDQISKIDDEQQTVRDGMQDIFQNAGGNPQDMTPAQRADMASKIQALNDKAVGDILTDPAQLKRYHELALQRQGAAALAQKAVQDQLNLTDDQRKQITDIQAKGQADQQAAIQAAGGFQAFGSMSDDDRAKFRDKMTSIQNDTNTKLLAVLTDAQKAQWKTMQGAPFTFPAGGGFGGGRRGGGGGGGRAGGGGAAGGGAAVQ
jgi:Spy/CpxP family protein refolding chaperone